MNRVHTVCDDEARAVHKLCDEVPEGPIHGPSEPDLDAIDSDEREGAVDGLYGFCRTGADELTSLIDRQVEDDVLACLTLDGIGGDGRGHPNRLTRAVGDTDEVRSQPVCLIQVVLDSPSRGGEVTKKKGLHLHHRQRVFLSKKPLNRLLQTWAGDGM